MWGKEWNDTLIAGLGTAVERITDHPLIGGGVAASVEPLDVYRDFMAVPEVLQHKWEALRDSMVKGGIANPRLAVTELQLFAHISPNSDTNAPVRLTYERMPGQPTITEAIYDTLIYHAAIRLAPFVELITHSAIVNHGGGLRKEREHVWANPCYYARSAFAAFGESRPVATEIEAASEQAPMVLPDLIKAAKSTSYSDVDALAALAKDGSLLLSIVNRRAGAGPLHLAVDLTGFRANGSAEVWTLAGDAPWEANTLEHQELVRPVTSKLPVQGNKLNLDIRPYSIVRLRVPSGSNR